MKKAIAILSAIFFVTAILATQAAFAGGPVKGAVPASAKVKSDSKKGPADASKEDMSKSDSEKSKSQEAQAKKGEDKTAKTEKSKK